MSTSGPVDSPDAALYDAAAGKRIDVVSLNSTRGQLGEGALKGAVIKALRLATRVEDGAVCASACFLLFVAGEPRTAHPNSFIDVHKAADNDDRETYKSREATRAMVEFARQLGVPRSSRSMAGAVKLSGSCSRPSRAHSDIGSGQLKFAAFGKKCLVCEPSKNAQSVSAMQPCEPDSVPVRLARAVKANM